jgi:hypothetical protein
MTDTARAIDIRELPLEPGGTVEIQLSSSDVRIRGTDADRVVVRTRAGEAIDAEIRIDAGPRLVRILDGDGGFRIGPLRVRTRGSADLDIELPRTAAVSLRTMSGDVVADGIGGPSRWASASGDLHVTVDGGPVAMDSMSGDAILEASVAVGLTARTVSGDLRVRAPRLDALNASTTSGDIRVEAGLGTAAAHSISSVSGDVEVATGSPVRLEAETIAGDVRATGTHRSEGARGRRILVTGDGSVRMSVRTTSGDVRLRALDAEASTPMPASPAETAAPASPAETAWLVAEAEAAPNLVRAEAVAPSAVDFSEEARLEVLRALERGDVGVETAMLRLEAIDEAGPLAFQGWSR